MCVFVGVQAGAVAVSTTIAGAVQCVPLPKVGGKDLDVLSCSMSAGIIRMCRNGNTTPQMSLCTNIKGVSTRRKNYLQTRSVMEGLGVVRQAGNGGEGFASVRMCVLGTGMQQRMCCEGGTMRSMVDFKRAGNTLSVKAFD